MTIFFMTLLAVVACQQLQPHQYGTDSKSGQTAATGFVPINDDHRITATVPETSSVQSRDYSGGSEFYGYNNYPNSYGPPSTSYGSGKNVHIDTKTKSTLYIFNILNIFNISFSTCLRNYYPVKI